MIRFQVWQKGEDGKKQEGQEMGEIRWWEKEREYEDSLQVTILPRTGLNVHKY